MEPAAIYASRGHKTVEGWLTTEAIDVLRALDLAQKREGVTGAVCEIGVHHGRLLILLHLLEPTHPSVAIDLFEQQDLNIDRSGAGSFANFKSNLQRHGGDWARVRVMSQDSTTVAPAYIEASAGGKVRLFSVDGGHTAQITQSDLKVADACLSDGGILILDDYSNEEWPDVALGTAQFLAANRRVVPFALGGNKMLFTTNEHYARRYRDVIASLSSVRALYKTFALAPIMVFQRLTLRNRLGKLRRLVMR